MDKDNTQKIIVVDFRNREVTSKIKVNYEEETYTVEYFDEHCAKVYDDIFYEIEEELQEELREVA